MMPALVYNLCLATSLIATALLIRSYRRSRSGLLLWTALCFALFAINNALLVVDRLVLPDTVDLKFWRQLTSLAAVSVLLYGFVTEAE